MMNKRMKPPIVPVVSYPNGGLVEEKRQAAGEADEPEEAMREAARPVSLVHNTMPNAF